MPRTGSRGIRAAREARAAKGLPAAGKETRGGSTFLDRLACCGTWLQIFKRKPAMNGGRVLSDGPGSKTARSGEASPRRGETGEIHGQQRAAAGGLVYRSEPGCSSIADALWIRRDGRRGRKYAHARRARQFDLVAGGHDAE